jgi:MFS family permease
MFGGMALAGRDARLLFAARAVRLFSYGLISVVLVLYLAAVGVPAEQIGLLLALTLAGDAVVSLWLTTHADRVGRRRVLIIGAILVLLAAAVFVATDVFLVLALAATLGVISPSGNEVGPFLAVETAALTQTVSGTQRTRILGYFNLVGSFATAIGALVGGGVAQLLIGQGLAPADAYRAVVITYGLLGLVMAGLFALVSPKVEVATPPDTSIQRRLGLHRSQRTVTKLSALFGLDAFGGGFVVTSLIAFWFSVRFGADPGFIGAVIFGANILAGLSSLAAAWIAARIGLIRTMVFTHLPSNVLLILIPFMPTLELAVAVLLFRFSISQMDVPTRQSYTMAVVQPDERSAAAGVTGITRTMGASAAQLFAAPLYASAIAAAPFVISGTLKIVYDLLLYREFRNMAPPEETPR